MILVLSLSVSGCAVRSGHPAAIPGCVGGFAFVPKGCYTAQLTDGMEVRCTGSTTKFHKCVMKAS